MIAQSASSFIKSYQAAFERLDPEAIADHFQFPCLITGDSTDITPQVITSREEWIPHLKQLVGGYRNIGFSSAEIRELTVVELSPHLFQAIVDWRLLDAGKGLLYDFQAVYTLAQRKGRLSISAIAHNEMPRFLESLRRRKSAPTSGTESVEPPVRHE